MLVTRTRTLSLTLALALALTLNPSPNQVELRIISPQSLTIALSNPTLKRIVPAPAAGSCSATDVAASAYQTTRVTG